MWWVGKILPAANHIQGLHFLNATILRLLKAAPDHCPRERPSHVSMLPRRTRRRSWFEARSKPPGLRFSVVAGVLWIKSVRNAAFGCPQLNASTRHEPFQCPSAPSIYSSAKLNLLCAETSANCSATACPRNGPCCCRCCCCVDVACET